MKNLIYILFLSLISNTFLKSQNYSKQWKQSDLGGGGFITGLVLHPTNANIVYGRCDVGGVFKSEDGGKSWNPINKGMTEYHHHQVRSLAMSPHNPEILFRCSGARNGGVTYGSIHKSVNGGASWYKVSDELDFYGNGPRRDFGEIIAVDPNDSNVVISGSYSKGIWRSDNVGENWKYVDFNGLETTNLRFHPLIKNLVIASFINHATHVGYLYFSYDKGKTWKLQKEFTKLEINEFTFDLKNPDIIYAACGNDGFLKSTDRGENFTAIQKGLPQGAICRSIANDPVNSNILYIALEYESGDDMPFLVPIFKTTDKGENWNAIKEYSDKDFSVYPSYMKNPKKAFLGISKVRVDNHDPKKLFVSNWFGVSISEDGGETWKGNNYKGTETTCSENVVTHPTIPGKAYFTLPDHHPFKTTDFGKSFRKLEHSTRYANGENFENTTGLVASRFKEGLIIYGGKDEWVGIHCAIMRSEDDGKSITHVKIFDDSLTLQAIREDYFKQGTFYAYMDRSIAKGAGLWKSEDWGLTWQRMNLNLPAYITRLPYQQNWIESDLLPITDYQQKNVCGTNQLLCLDPHKEGCIYFGEWTEGIFKTEDGGKTWSDISKGLPFHKNKATALVDIKADENKPGVIYAGFVHEGLWRSENRGQTWKKIFPLDDNVFNASSTVIGGENPNEIFVACEPLHWSKTQSAVYYSQDNGKSWINLYDQSFGCLRWKGIAVDKSSGVIYGVTCGNGVFYLEKEEKK